MKIISAIVIFIFINAFLIISNNNIALDSGGNLSKFINLYFLWVSKTAKNMASITSYVINTDWTPPSQTQLARNNSY